MAQRVLFGTKERNLSNVIFKKKTKISFDSWKFLNKMYSKKLAGLSKMMFSQWSSSFLIKVLYIIRIYYQDWLLSWIFYVNFRHCSELAWKIFSKKQLILSSYHFELNIMPLRKLVLKRLWICIYLFLYTHVQYPLYYT